MPCLRDGMRFSGSVFSVFPQPVLCSRLVFVGTLLCVIEFLHRFTAASTAGTNRCRSMSELPSRIKNCRSEDGLLIWIRFKCQKTEAVEILDKHTDLSAIGCGLVVVYYKACL